MRKRQPSLSPSPPHRGGTTLTEVLMALLCLGIGVVSVASLFPIALLRSVQATQLTSGTILRFNAETLVDLDINLVFNPDNNTGATRFSEHFNTAYLVDPLGAAFIREEQNLAATDPVPVGPLSRFDFGLTTIPAAANLVTLPDSWVRWYEATAVLTPGMDTSNATFPWQYVDVPASAISAAALLEIETILPDPDTATPNPYGRDLTQPLPDTPVRVVLFDNEGRLSETRTLANKNFIDPATGRIQWPGGRALALPRYSTVSRVMLEFGERRYTWLLSVRNYTTDPTVPQALVDVVICFRRAPSTTEELRYQLDHVSGRTYTVSIIDTTADPNPALTPPSLKKGGFLLDTETGTWHRIQDVDEVASPPRVTFERNTGNTLEDHRAVFMKGVIDVYPLGNKP